MAISLTNWSESSFFQWFSHQLSVFAQSLYCFVYSSLHLYLSASPRHNFRRRSLFMQVLSHSYTHHLNRHMVGCGCHEILIQPSFNVLFSIRFCHFRSTASSFSRSAAVSQIEEFLHKIAISPENWSESSFFQWKMTWFSHQISTFAHNPWWSVQDTTLEGVICTCWCSLTLPVTTSKGIWYAVGVTKGVTSPAAYRGIWHVAGATRSWLYSQSWSKSFAGSSLFVPSETRHHEAFSLYAGALSRWHSPTQQAYSRVRVPRNPDCTPLPRRSFLSRSRAVFRQSEFSYRW